MYNIIFNSVDLAGNIGADSVVNVTYDVTRPYAENVTFGLQYGRQGMNDTVIVEFSEKMTASPKINLTFGLWDEFQGAENPGAPSEAGTIITGDMIVHPELGDSVWTFPFVIPSDTINNGPVIVWFDDVDLPQDYATNIIDGFPGFEGLDTANTLIPLEIDNRISKAVISYNNISNPLFNIRNEDSNPEGFYSYPIAIGGQQIQISVKMNIPIKGTMQPVDSNEDNDFSDLEDIPSVPSLSFFYNNANSGVGSSIIHQGYDSVSTDSLTWYYSLMVADGDNNDGDLDLIFTAKDRSGNDVEMFENTDILKVDNIHPQAFQTGNVVIYGLNPVQGWISGNTDSIEVKIPIVGPASDTSLYAGSSTYKW